MDDGESEVLLEGIEIAIAVEQRVVMANALRRNQQIDGFANRAARASKESIILRGINRKLAVMEFDQLELHEVSFDGRRLPLVVHSHQDFGQYQRGQTKTFVLQTQIQPFGFGIGHAVEEVDKDARVDNDHGLVGGPVGAHRVEIAFPVDLATPLSQRALTTRLDQQPQRFFDGGALGGQSGSPHRLGHQVVVNVDVGAHGRCIF